MVDDLKPLTNKDATNFTEIFALLTLKLLFPDLYGLLAHKDRPDIIDITNNVGIEVTQGVNPVMAAAIHEWRLSFEETNPIKGAIRHKKMEKYGEPFQGGIQSWSRPLVSRKNILNAIKKKAGKFSSYNMDVIDLFVDTDFAYSVDKRELNEIGTDIQERLKPLNIKYRYIYILTTNFLFQFNINSQIFKIVSYPSSKQEEVGSDVRKIIFRNKSSISKLQ